MREHVDGIPSPDDASAQGVTIEEVLAQLHLVRSTAPAGYDKEGLARLQAWMAAGDPADGDATGPAEPALE